jgi:penicillin-binding protein 1A
LAKPSRSASKRREPSFKRGALSPVALEHGLTPDTIRDDRPIELKNWRPEN